MQNQNFKKYRHENDGLNNKNDHKKLDTKVWCRGFLHIYSFIPNICKAIDKLVVTKGVNSFGKSAYCTIETTEEQAKNIIDLMQRKVDFINLKLFADNALIEMGDKAKILVLKFIEGLSANKICDVLKLTTRTFFRKLENATKSFETTMAKNMLTNQKVYRSILQQDFLYDLFVRINNFKKLCFENYSAESFFNSICGFVVGKIKKAQS